MLEQIFITDDLEKDPQKGVNSPMREFLRGKTVFLTGSTGFLGKLFIEKLVRCEVSEIVLLIRGKRGRTPRERLQRQFEREVIYTGYTRNPDRYWNRIRIMDGALHHNDLGLSEVDLDYLYSKVNVIIHSAADVRFDVSLKTSLMTNVFGTNELLKLALGMKKLLSVVHISTAYSNCIQEVVEEKFYPFDVDPMVMIRLAEMADEEHLDACCNKIIHPWPNTYTYAKMLSEQVVRGYCGRLPVAVIRPSIVTSTMEDPIEGWTDNVYGLNGVIVGVGSGVLRILHLNQDCHVDFVPADLVVNSCLALSWYTAVHQSDEPPNEDEIVFNCTSRSDNPFTYRNVYQYSESFRAKIPTLRSLWYPTYNITESATMCNVLQFFYHFLPALLFDSMARLKGIKPKVLFLYRKVQQFAEVLQFFTTNEWEFENTRMRQVYDSMVQDDKEYFPADVKAIDWGDYFNIYLLGLRKYIIGESLDNLEQARRRHTMLKIAHYLLLALIYFAFAYVGYVLLRWTPMKAGFERISDIIRIM
ncbi:fatty acyl-CoA reductase wat-like [Toxorhynchites rutilus septentrionalis]|uniref:fatty acyl-CoA reductase wat-like n=1 Tax=Toxorhynchites rutilus septentrionalis TaxID=329112 RepID=UPI0024792E48|nr:fatty acyl-CoA reductase wat-like [Toxorhynchites rutilus septentrionalis]